jgi:hypothetical protein
MTNADRLSPEYRVFTTDLLTNKILSEIPLRGISYETSLVNAGECSGDIFIDSESRKYDLYNATMPGKTGLYVLRNNVCVWGGIIWSRDYALDERKLSISASEFTSYLYHRTIWKTFTNAFSGKLTVTDKVAANRGASTLEILNGLPYKVSEGDVVRIVFPAESSKYNSYYDVAQDSIKNTIYVTTEKKSYRVTHKKVTSYKTNKKRATVEIYTQTPHNLKRDDQYAISDSGDALSGSSIDGKHSAVLSVPNENTFTIYVYGGQNGYKSKDNVKVALAPASLLTVSSNLPAGKYDVSVYIKNSIYEFVKSLIDSMGKDFSGTEFPNVEIEAGRTSTYDIASYKVNGGVATLKTTTPHGLTPSQKITIFNVNPSINGEHTVKDVIGDDIFTYEVQANYIDYSEISEKTYSISNRQTLRKITTYTTTANHSLSVGDTVQIDNVPDITRTVDASTTRVDVYNGEYIVEAIPAMNKFSHRTSVPADDNIDYLKANQKTNPYAISYPRVQVGTYGPYPQYADLGFTFDESDRALFNIDISTSGVRGFNLTSVGEFLDTFANATEGSSTFDYRIECRYDANSNSFERVFRFVPVSSGYNFVDAERGLKYLGADSVIFEYPGNISSFSISESAEDSMTRMFVVGNKEGLSEDASQPYSAGSSPVLGNGWPLLDATEDASDVDDEGMLGQIADRYVGESIPPIMDFSISINGSIAPVVGSYSPGQWCSIIVDDEFIRMRLESDYEPRNDVLLRKIMSIKVSVSDSSTFAEKVDLVLVPELEVNGFAE